MADDLILATAPLTEHRHPIAADRVRAILDAAQDAGFDGVSIWTAHHDFAVADGMTSEGYFEYHGERGLSVPVSEVILEFASADADAIVDASAHVLDVSAQAGASYVIAACLEPEVGPIADVARGLALVCDLAADRGLQVSLEFMATAAVATLRMALDVIEAADRDNLGLVLDLWQWFRQPGGPDLPRLRSVPRERVHVLQLNDAHGCGPNLTSAEQGLRLLPGDGVVDIAEVLQVLDEIGADPMIISEVFSSELSALEPTENAQRQYAAARAVLDRRADEEPGYRP
jgi:sugar phosphate isomerase/epimerase